MSSDRSLKYLRKMTNDDLAKVMQGEVAAYPQPWTLKNFQDCLKRSFYSCWVFEQDKQDEQIKGHVIISAGAGEAHLLNICVYPKLQGQGWGRKLLLEAEWIAKQHRAENFILEVRPSNTVGMRLYESEGYNEIGCRKGYYPTATGREDAIVMAKALFIHDDLFT